MTEENAVGGQPETDKLMNPCGSLAQGENMMRTTCDGKGRIYLEESVRAKYGESFLVLEGRRELILRPIPRDPMQDLREIGRKLEGYSIEALKRMVDEQADKEVSETLERLGLKRIPLESEPGRSATAAAGGPR